ncbi:MAG: AAC(3) family N-acetyltransferase, partial [Armatimonadota bacterium]|nr:AAC(3) family N-acetyltransferase [Armatimonadota bacterium]
HRLAMGGGKILLLGVDQDRNTTLHTAEALAGAPYLSQITASYVEDDGSVVTIPVAAMAGPHRDFIGLDRRFREAGVMRVGRIGRAVCRLLDASGMLKVALEALAADPAAVLCDNPACRDCVMQRGRIKAARLAREDFCLAAVAGDISDSVEEVAEALQGEGIAHVEVTAAEHQRYGSSLSRLGLRLAALQGTSDDHLAAELAASLGVPYVVSVTRADALASVLNLRGEGRRVLVRNAGVPSRTLAAFYADHPDAPPLAFNPAGFATAGEKPFLGVFYRGILRKQTAHFYVDDATWGGAPALPGRGNAEVKEILSMLRCRGYDGVVTLRSHHRGIPAFRQAAAAFWQLLETM